MKCITFFGICNNIFGHSTEFFCTRSCDHYSLVIDQGCDHISDQQLRKSNNQFEPENSPAMLCPHIQLPKGHSLSHLFGAASS
jgi:hypothetical protein